MLNKFLKYLFILYFTIFSVTPSFASGISPLTLPTGGQVASGNININESAPGKLVVNQTTNQGIINWQSFNVGVDAAVHFNTPNASAGTLNNISGGTSTILGSIFSNGRLFFANPSGIIFKPGSQVKAEGLVASAMKISNQDFLANNFNFTNNQIASLQNEGNLEAQYVALIAPQVLNKGTITTNVATMIAAGDDVKLSISDSNRLSVNINPAKIKTLSSNEGVIKSENGTVSIQANAAQELVDQTINTPRSADSLISENGVIKLVSNSGSIKAKNVNLSAGRLGGTEVSGTIDASSNAKGGDIEITGKEIQVKSNSKLLAMGETGGGNILVGGDWQGSNGVLQATYTTVEKDTLIDVSSTGVGDGGKIVVWSDIHNPNSKTMAKGKLYAKANVGDGGKIETSGYALDIENADPNTLSIYGKAGNYLIDPYNYTINSNDWSNINSALNSSDVTINTNGAGYGSNYGRSGGNDLSGRIEFNPGNRIYTGSRDATLTLTAANNVEINADISTESKKLNITANADYVFGIGDLNLRGGVFTANTSSNTSNTYSGVLSNLSLIKSGDGTLTLSGANTYTGATTVSAGTLSLLVPSSNTARHYSPSYNISSGATLEYNTPSDTVNYSQGDVTYSGQGTIKKVGIGQIQWGQMAATFALSSGSLIDVQEGTFVGGSSGNEVWTNNLSNLNIASGANFKGVEAPIVIDALTGAGTLYTGLNGWPASVTMGVNNTQAGTYNPAGSATFTGVITNTDNNNLGKIIKNGSGTQILSGANTYSGATTVSAGTLSVTGTLGSGTYAGNIANSATLAMGSSSNQTLSGVISGTGALTKSGSGTLTLSGANTYSGATTVSAGTLSVTGTLGSGTYAGNIANSATLAMGSSSNQTLSGVISGTGALTKSGSGTLTLSGANTYSGATTVSAGTLAVTANNALGTNAAGTTVASGANLDFQNINYSTTEALTVDGGTIKTSTGASTVAGTIALGANSTFDVGGTSLTSSGVISGTGALTKSGSGTLTLSGANTYSGATTVSAGTLSVTGTLGSGTYAGNIANSATLAMGSSSNQTLSGVISGTGALTKSGSGTLTLSGANTYSGGTTLTTGQISLGISQSSSSTSGALGTGALTMNGGTLGNTSSYGSIYNDILVNTGTTSTLKEIAGSNLHLAGNITGSGTLQVDNTSGWTVTLAGDNSGFTGTYTQPSTTNGNTGFYSSTAGSANASWELSAGRFVNEVSGGNISLGSLYSNATSGYLLGSSGGNNNASYTIGGKNLNSTFTGTIENNYPGASNNVLSITKSGTGTLTLSGTNTYTGATTISAGTLSVTGTLGSGTYAGNITNSATLAMGSNSNQTLSGVISGTGALTKSGSGTLTLSGANTYSGATTVSAGTLSVTGTLGSGTYAGNIANSATLAMGSSSNQTLSGVISGTGALTKSGSGTLTLSGANTYSGATTVSAGTLAVTANNALGTNAAGTTVASGANLDFQNINYSTTEALTVDGGTIKTSTGASTVAGTIALGANSTFDVGGTSLTSSGVISGTGALTKSGSGTLTLSGANTYSGATTVSAGTLSVTGTLGSGTYAGNIANSATLAMGSSSNQTLSGVISGTGALTKSGSGTLTLSGANTYSGATTVSVGTLSASSLADTTAVSVASGATYQLDQNDTVASIAGAGNINLQARTLTSAGASDTNFSGIISGTGGLTLTGSNNLTLSGANTYSGTTHINGGGLVLANSNALASNSITSTSGRLKTTERVSDLTVAGNVTLIGDVATSGAQTYNNNVTIGAGSAVNPLTISSQNSDITFSGTVKTGSGAKAAQRSLTVNAGIGNVNFNDRIGYAFNGVGFNAGLTADSPYALSVTGGNITLKGDVMTFETQTYNGAVKIGGNGSNGTTRTLLSMDPKITFNGTVDDTQTNTHTLVAKAVQIRNNVLVSGAPEVNFNRSVSSITSLAGYQGLTGYQIVSNEFGSIDPSASFGTVRLPSSSSSSSSSSSTSQAEQRNIEKKISSLKTNIANSSSSTKTGMTLSQLFSSFIPQAGTSFVKSIEIVYPDSPNFGAGKINQNLPADVKSNNNLNQNKSNQTKPNNQQNQKQNSSGGINDDERL